MKLSIVIPAYNEEKYIARCLKSVLGQIETLEKKRDIEIIVVNNASSDKTVEIVSQFIEAGVLLVHENERGLPKARQAGLDASSGDLIANVDADLKTRAIIGRLKGGEHVEKIVQRIGLTGNDALRPLRPGEFRQQLGHVIGHGAVLNIGPEKNLPDEDVEIEVGGDAQATAALKQCVQQGRIIEDLIARFLVGEQTDQPVRIPDFRAEHRQDKVDVFGGELHPAVGLNHFHGLCCVAPLCICFPNKQK